MLIGAIHTITQTSYYIGWNDNASYGIDIIATGNRYDSYAAYVESPIYLLGTQNDKVTLNEVDIIFDQPLASGDSVRLYHRIDPTAAYSVLGTYDYTTYGAVTTINATLPSLVDLTLVQLKVGMEVSVSSYVGLREIRIK